VHESVYPRFVDGFVTAAKSIKVGDGLEEGVTMGPVAMLAAWTRWKR
jgi:succinate-semialdehyde dehydrogenase / glutarate-semialdehyde dehydrogenase